MSFEGNDRSDIGGEWDDLRATTDLDAPHDVICADDPEDGDQDIDDNPWGGPDAEDVVVTRAEPYGDATAVAAEQNGRRHPTATDEAVGTSALTGTKVEVPAARDASDSTADPVPAEQKAAEDDPGRASITEIRSLLRSGEIKFGQINPVIASRYAAEREALRAEVRGWIDQHPSPGMRTEDAVTRFSNAWTLYSLRDSDPRAMMADGTRMTQALEAYVSDVNAMRAMGTMASSEVNAIYNNVDEVRQCFDMKAESRHLTDEAIRRCAENRPTDVVGSVKDYLLKAKTLEEQFGTRLDDPLLRHFAARQSVETCVDRVKDYFRDVDLLTERYRGHEFVSPSVIRTVCKDSPNPGLIIEDRLAVADDIMDSYAGREGLTRAEVFKTIMDHSNPTKRLDGYMQSIDRVRETFQGRLPDDAIRTLCLGPRPMAAGRALIAKIDALTDEFRDDPNVQPGTIMYFARNNRDADNTDLVDKVRQYSSNVTVATEHFAGDSRVNRQLINRCSLQTDAKVIDVIDGKLRVMSTLKERYADADVPDWLYKRLISHESDPEAALKAHLREMGELTEEFGNTFAPSVMRIANMRYDNVRDRLAERAPIVEKWRTRYGNVISETDLQWGAVMSKDPEARLASIVAKALLKDMRALHRDNTKGYSRPHPDLVERIDAFEGHVGQWADQAKAEGQAAGIDTDRAIRGFMKSVMLYSRAPGSADILADDRVAKALWDKYWEDTCLLRDIGFKRPEVAAAYNDGDTLAAHILGSDRPKRDLALADSRIADPLGRITQYQADVAQLQQHFSGNDLVTPALIQHVAKGYPTDPVGTMEDQVRKLREVRDLYRDIPQVTDDVYRFLGNNFYVNPAGEVAKYLDRYQKIEQAFSGDPDFTDEVKVQLSLSTTRTDRDDLAHLGRDYKERLSEMRRQVVMNGHNLDDDLVMTAAARKGTSISGRLHFAMTLQRVRTVQTRAKEVRLDAPAGFEAGDSELHERVSDPTEMTTEEIAVDNIDRQKRLEVLGELLADVSDAEKALLLKKVADVADVGMDDTELKAHLKTDDLDEYTRQLMERLNRLARRRSLWQGADEE